MIALTDGIGAIEERYAYSAYGEPIFVSATGTVLTDSAKDNRYTYTGREWDEELNLYHFRARMYDAKSGRFCGKDPLGYVDGQSRYADYFTPMFVDPLGLVCEKPDPSEGATNSPCDGKFTNEGEENVYKLCMVLCQSIPITNPTDICNKCDKLPWRTKKLCDWLCKRAQEEVGLPDLKNELCNAMCCSGKLPKGVPGDKCLATQYDKDGKKYPRPEAEVKCLSCCDSEYGQQVGNEKIMSQCKKMCYTHAG